MSHFEKTSFLGSAQSWYLGLGNNSKTLIKAVALAIIGSLLIYGGMTFFRFETRNVRNINGGIIRNATILKDEVFTAGTVFIALGGIACGRALLKMQQLLMSKISKGEKTIAEKSTLKKPLSHIQRAIVYAVICIVVTLLFTLSVYYLSRSLSLQDKAFDLNRRNHVGFFVCAKSIKLALAGITCFSILAPYAITMTALEIIAAKRSKELPKPFTASLT